MSPRIAHLKHTPKLSLHLFPNPRVSSMGWLPLPKPTLTAGGDTWNTKTKLTLSTLASPANSEAVPKVVTWEYRLAAKSGQCFQFYTHRSLQHSKASHYFQIAAGLSLSVHDLCPSKSNENSFQPKTCWCTNITAQSVCIDSLLANWSSNSLLSPQLGFEVANWRRKRNFGGTDRDVHFFFRFFIFYFF